MPTNIPSFIIGYHGCDKSVAEKVLSGSTHLKVSKNRYDWLGWGIYFWENNPHRAFQWAKEQSTNPKSKIKTPYAVGAIIDPGNCLELTEAKSIELIKNTQKMLEHVAKAQGIKLPDNEGLKGDRREGFPKRKLDCHVINALHNIRDKKETPFDTVRSPFFEGGRIYRRSGFFAKSHIQLCVRSHKSIIGYFRILDKSVFSS